MIGMKCNLPNYLFPHTGTELLILSSILKVEPVTKRLLRSWILMMLALYLCQDKNLLMKKLLFPMKKITEQEVLKEVMKD